MSPGYHPLQVGEGLGKTFCDSMEPLTAEVLALLDAEEPPAPLATLAALAAPSTLNTPATLTVLTTLSKPAMLPRRALPRDAMRAEP
eukprot:scaffold85184_cov52-Phaeocystis_antarctica.AAC.2